MDTWPTGLSTWLENPAQSREWWQRKLERRVAVALCVKVEYSTYFYRGLRHL